MCGITGLFDTRAARMPDEALLARMNDSQFHRGPDEGSLHIEPGVGFGHRRLSVIDVATGQQPLHSADGSAVIVFNGEVYNFQTLREELKALGRTFLTKSDTEVVLQAWCAWGEKCVERLRGMFAFAIWDRQRQMFFMARDRLGVKPLHYAVMPDGWLAFGSELKTITAHPLMSRELDPRAAEEFFALGYVCDPRTIYKSAKKLPAGHMLAIRRGEAAGEPRPYWDVRFTLDNPISLDDACVEMRERLAESVKLRMISEVPLGAFLSGGVDSSAVVATMAGLQSDPVTTCSISFDDPAYDEGEYARRVAEQYRTDHHVQTVRVDDHELVDRLAHLYDEPFADSSALPTYRVSEMARRFVTVALSGDGADENLGGYRRHRMHVAEEKFRAALPLGLRRPVFGLLGKLYPKADWAPQVLRAKTTLTGLAHDSIQAYCESVSILKSSLREQLYSDRFKRELGGVRAVDTFREHGARAGTDDPLALVQYIDLKTYLVGDINTKVDRASMAHSLEVREPLLDHELVEWQATLPSHLKVRGQLGKVVLKKAMEPMLPHDLLYRPKMGFSVPIGRWLKGPLAGRMRETVLGERMAATGWFEPRMLRRMADEHVAGQRDHTSALWALMMFEAFLRLAEGQAARPPVPAARVAA